MHHHDVIYHHVPILIYSCDVVSIDVSV